MNTIFPYKLTSDTYRIANVSGLSTEDKGVWVFDDEDTNLDQEALVSGTDEVLDLLTKDIPNAHEGVKLTFSDSIFDGYQMVGCWVKSGKANKEYDYGIVGNWYKWSYPFSHAPGILGWLCPALFLYYGTPPAHLYVRIDAK